MKNIKTFRQIKEQLKSTIDHSNTFEGWVKFDNIKMYARVHWSQRVEGFPVYKDESCRDFIGYLKSDGKWFPYLVNGVQQKKNEWIPIEDSFLILDTNPTII
jgi:hypothetical protein